MTTNLILNGGSRSGIKRPRITANGYVSDLDGTVKSHLDELNRLLSKRIFRRDHYRKWPEEARDEDADAAADGIEEEGRGDLPERLDDLMANDLGNEIARDRRMKADDARRPVQGVHFVPAIKQLLGHPLTPKRIVGDMWAPASLAAEFHNAEEAAEWSTLADYIDMTPKLSALKYAFESSLAANKFTLSPITKSVLEDYPAIRDYLVAYAYEVMELREVNGVANFILKNKTGAKNVADYAIVGAARTIIDRDQLRVTSYNVDNSEFVTRVKAAGLSLTANTFEPLLHDLIKDFIFNSDELELIEGADIGKIPPEIKPLLVKYIQHSPVPITADNVNFFLPLFISQIKDVKPATAPSEVDQEESDKDFEVTFLEDDRSMIQISQSAVKCAAQLYYGMILGDELEVFNVATYFTHKYLIRGEIEILDGRLREDLQTYVFSNRFTNLNTNKVVDRTRPAERQMFYRQVFNYGNAQFTHDLIPNREFTKLWKVLMLESARYLERAQESPNPDAYVSRQNVMQAVEDLQYNLSTHCTGMANVITPLIYAELDFVMRRILMHPEIVRQIVPNGGTWWRVVEKLYMGMKNMRPKATVLHNKAKLGYDIIRSIATYNPVSFEEDTEFFDFLSKVDAFITTQSILQEALTDDLKEMDGNDEAGAHEPRMSGMGMNGTEKTAREATGVPGNSGTEADSEWDF